MNKKMQFLTFFYLIRFSNSLSSKRGSDWFGREFVYETFGTNQSYNLGESRSLFMKFFFLICSLLFLNTALAADRFGNLDEKDQKFFKNDSRDGKNQLERIDSNVRQINLMMGEIQSMKKQIEQLRAEVDELKSTIKK